MADASNGSDQYRLHHSKKVGASLRELYQESEQQGQDEAFLAALRRIARLLHRDPWTVGELCIGSANCACRFALSS